MNQKQLLFSRVNKLNLLLGMYDQNVAALYERPGEKARGGYYFMQTTISKPDQPAVMLSPVMNTVQALAWIAGAQALFLQQTDNLYMCWDVWAKGKIVAMHVELERTDSKWSAYPHSIKIERNAVIPVGPYIEGHRSPVYLTATDFNVYLAIDCGFAPLWLLHETLVDPKFYGWVATTIYDSTVEYQRWLRSNHYWIKKAEANILKEYGFKA